MSSPLYKLETINYEMAVHPGTAKERLASQAHKIMVIPPSSVPEECRKEFEELVEKIDVGMAKFPNLPGFSPSFDFQNRTATKYIKLLWKIEALTR